MDRRLIMRAVAASALLLSVGSALGPGSGGAQDATPAMMQEMSPHPAHIHAGACPDVGDVVFPLEDVSATDVMATPMGGMASDATPMAGEYDDMNEEMGQVVGMSATIVEAPLTDILGAEHAINVHESAERIENYIACGDTTGEPEDGVLETMLEERNDSGVEGKAYLTDNGDDTTTVEILLMQVPDDEMSEAEATPTS